jgi:phosphonate transport system permease protein
MTTITSSEATSRALESTGTSPMALSASARERLLEPFPRITQSMLATLVVIVLAYVWGLAGTRADPVELVEGIPNIARFVVRLFPPAWDFTEVALVTPAITLPLGLVVPQIGLDGVTISTPTVLFALFETIQMAIIGTSIAAVLAIPFGLLAARNITPHPYVYSATRFVMNANRAIPEIIFALIFVSAVGLGPFAGVLALGVGEIGIMAKLYSEAIEAIDPKQVQAVTATGANRLQTFAFGVVPQALPLVASYWLLMFERNVRSATILGIVGAGGVGFYLSKYMALFQYPKLMGGLVLIVTAVTLIDRTSDYVRRRLI